MARKPLPVLGDYQDEQILDYELDGTRRWTCRNLGPCSREMGALPLYLHNEKGKRKPLIGWKCASDCSGFEARNKEEDRLDRDGLGKLAAAILEEHPVSKRHRELQNKAKERIKADRLADREDDLEEMETPKKKRQKKPTHKRVENVLDDIVDEKSRRKAIVDLRFNRSVYAKKDDGPDLDPEKLARVKRLITEYSEESLKPTSEVPYLKTLETMTPEERAEMERLYAPIKPSVKTGLVKYDKSSGAVDRLMTKGPK